MSRLVRARIKAIEQLPEWAKCCDETVALISEMSELEIVIDTSLRELAPERFCRYCGTNWPQVPWTLALKQGEWVELAVLDIDEGPLEEMRQ